MNLIEEVAYLKKELAYRDKKDKEKDEYIRSLVEELEKTQQLLRLFLNENTPPSKLPFKADKHKDNKKEPKHRGKPKGSNGGTKEPPDKVDRKVKSKLGKACKRCGRQYPRSEILKRLRYVYNAYFKTEIIEVEEEFIYCDCGEFCVGTHPEVPKNSMLGYDLQALLTELKHNFSGSYENISKFLKIATKGVIDFAPITYNNTLQKISEKLKPSYDKMESKLPESDHAYSDETGWFMNGEKWWLWLLVTPLFVFITIEKSRARKVLTDLFGEKYQGGIISDSFKVYRDFAKWFQKCWVHFLRKLKHEAEKYPDSTIPELYEQLKKLHRKMADFIKSDPSPDLRKRKKKEYEKILNDIINYKGWCQGARDIINNWLVTYKGHWLKAIEIPGISLDNNYCERKIRKCIGWRKMLGGHRTRHGTKEYAIIETHRQTWILHEKNPYEELLIFLKTPVECIV